jgi:hypothetical protein
MSPISEIYTLEYSPESSASWGDGWRGGWIRFSFWPSILEGRGCTPLVVKVRVRNGVKRNEIKVFLLERNGTPTALVRGIPYPGYFAKCAEAHDFKRVEGNSCFQV